MPVRAPFETAFGRLDDDVILLQPPEFFSLLFSSVNLDYCFLNLSRIDKFKWESKNEMSCGRCSQMSSSWKWPILTSSEFEEAPHKQIKNSIVA